MGRAARERRVVLWAVGRMGGRRLRRRVELQDGFVGGGVEVAAARRRCERAGRRCFIVRFFVRFLVMF
jgi:hypothetical protein